MTTSVSNLERARQRDVTNAITGKFWCVGGPHEAPLSIKCRFHGKDYCKACRDKARDRMRADK